MKDAYQFNLPKTWGNAVIRHFRYSSSQSGYLIYSNFTGKCHFHKPNVYLYQKCWLVHLSSLLILSKITQRDSPVEPWGSYQLERGTIVIHV